MYIANRAFDGLRKFSAIYQHRQIFNLAFNMIKLKTKYKNVAQSKIESSSLSTALLAIVCQEATSAIKEGCML